MNSARPYKFLGISDERLTCECCGRDNLKRTVAVEFQDSQEVLYFGTSCAAKALALTSKEVEKSAKGAQAAREAAEAAAKREAEYLEAVRFSNWLRATFGVDSIHLAVEKKLGRSVIGLAFKAEYQAIKELYRAA